MRSCLIVIALVIVACGPTAAGPSPSASVTLTATPSPSPSATAVPSSTPLARVAVSDAPITSGAGAYLLFQLPGQTRLRAISWDASTSGLLPGEVPPNVAWSQSPYGAPYLAGSTVLDRDGRSIGTVPWARPDVNPTWTIEGTSLCAAVPERVATGAAMRFERWTLGETPRVVASGFATYSDNAGYPVLACDTGSDRAIVAVFGQGIAPARLWIFKLATGGIVRSVDYGGSGWVTASADASMLAESVTSQGAWMTTIRRADDGAQLATIDDFIAHGFSGDGSLVVGATGPAGLTSTALVEWKTGRRVWSGGRPFGGYLSEPSGARVAVGVGFAGGSDTRDVYIVSPDGSAVLLPAGVRVGWRY